MKRIKLAFAIWSLEGMGGAERLVYDLVRKLDRTAYAPIIISFRDGMLRQMYEEIDSHVYIVSKKKRYDLSFIKGLRRILVENKVDILNVHHFGPFLYLVLAATGLQTKIVYTVHSRWSLEHLPFFKRLLNRLLIKKIHGVVAISKQIEDYYLRNLRLEKNKLHFITNGIDITRFQKKECRRLREEMGIGLNEKVIGIIANIRPEKNHKLLITAFQKLVSEMKAIRLVIVGEDCMNGEMQKLVATSHAYEKVCFLGFQSNIAEIFGIFDVFCLPSFYEGLPISILEAMASKVAVVGSDVSGINEVVRNGENGLLFPSNNEQKLIEALFMLLSDGTLRERLAEAGNSFVARYHSLEVMVKEYENLFQIVNRAP